jgi:diguanylate cyclase (GGDEF)-like protein
MLGDRHHKAQTAGGQLTDTHSSVIAIDRRNCWLWASASVLMLLLIGSNSISQGHVTVLLGLTLLSLVCGCQQMRIRSLREELSGKVERLLSAKAHAEDFQKLSMIDSLTGLYNRRFVEKHLEAEIARAHRLSRPLTLMALDLDRFKEVNDTLGHAAGDLVLKHFAGLLRNVIRASDVAVRMGGDEFLVLLPECTLDETKLLLPRLRNLKVEYEGMVINVEFSAGCASSTPGSRHWQSSEQLLNAADEALYATKRSRRASAKNPSANCSARD